MFSNAQKLINTASMDLLKYCDYKLKIEIVLPAFAVIYFLGSILLFVLCKGMIIRRKISGYTLVIPVPFLFHWYQNYRLTHPESCYHLSHVLPEFVHPVQVDCCHWQYLHQEQPLLSK